ncbi:MAG: hypothetical protein DCC67_08520 [Planctomycetota bacterium]|nr:MAG: hypothetical protein DCC67_08520 [Planctomycetota bacterium]
MPCIMKARGKDDRVTVLTPPGRGAIAVVAAMGDAALRTIGDNFCAASGRPLDEQEMNRIAFGYWTSGQHREDVVLVRTAVNAWEIHCHGGAVASQRIVAALQAAVVARLVGRRGARPDRPRSRPGPGTSGHSADSGHPARPARGRLAASHCRH